jgi:O-antigen/teichoic acid export membrane protein
VLGVFANGYLAYRLVPRLATPTLDVPTLSALLRFALPLGGSSVIGGALVAVEKVTLASTTSMAAMAYYMVPHSVVSRMNAVPLSYSYALYPAFSALEGSGQRNQVVELSRRSTRSIFLFFSPLILFLLLFGDPILELWIGPEVARESSVILQVLLVATFIQAFATVPRAIIQAMGRSDVILRIDAVQFAIVLPVSIVVIGSHGALGAAIAWLVKTVLETVLSGLSAVRLTGVGLSRTARAMLTTETVSLLVGSALLWLGCRSLGESVALGSLAAAITGGLLLTGVAWAAVLRRARAPIALPEQGRSEA